MSLHCCIHPYGSSRQLLAGCGSKRAATRRGSAAIIFAVGMMHQPVPSPAQELHDSHVNQHGSCTKHKGLCQQVHHSAAQHRVCEGTAGSMRQTGDRQGS